VGYGDAMGDHLTDRVRDDDPLVPLVFLPRGKVFDAALADAEAAGEVTPALTAAFHDPAVAAARWYELGVVAAIIVLMVTKPF
jgi:hypothetical protein